MKAYRIDRFGSVDGIVLRSSDDPRPGPKEILMRVRASSLNYRDLMVLKGGGRGPTKLGVVPLSDATGYGRRSLAETAVGRYKAIIGPKLRARILPAQQGETAIAAEVLNRMIRVAKPASIRAA
jgi:NADPH:quinone reductase-like Zn-dependent oxidoreductase